MEVVSFVIGVGLCIQKCLELSDCKSIYYNRVQLMCKLAWVEPNSVKSLAAFEDYTWTKTDNLSTRHCERRAFMKTLTLHSKEFKCVTASSYRCGPPPVLNNSDIISENGRIAFYNCKENFQSCAAVMHSVCDVTRGWSPVDECRRNSWKNPMKVFFTTWRRSISFPCKQNENIEAQIGMKFGKKIGLNVKNSDSVTRILLLQGGKAFAHLRIARDVSFHHQQTDKTVMEGINPQKNYQLTVYMTKDEIQIKINGSSQINCYRKFLKNLEVVNVFRFHEGIHLTSLKLMSGVSQGPSKLICPEGSFIS